MSVYAATGWQWSSAGYAERLRRNSLPNSNVVKCNLVGSLDQLPQSVGFLNRWNDTMATPLEEEPIEVGEKNLARSDWAVGKHHS